MNSLSSKPMIAAASVIGLAATASASAIAIPYCFVPTDDAYISMYPSEADSNTGTSLKLDVRNQIGSSAHNDNFQRDTLLKFDLTSMPPNETVVRATLYLFYFDYHDSNPAARTLVMHRLEEDWDEATVTWNTQPLRTTVPSATCPVPSALDQWMAFDVTDDVLLFVSGQVPNYGWVLTDPVPWGTFNIPVIRLRSMENEQFVPYLLLETSCIADFDGSGDIGFSDLTTLLSLWGTCP